MGLMGASCENYIPSRQHQRASSSGHQLGDQIFIAPRRGQRASETHQLRQIQNAN